MRSRGPAKRRIWRPELAYAIGLLVTDGNLSPDRRHISLTSRDLELLATFGTIMEARNRICIQPGGLGQAFRLTFGDRLFYEWLVGLGITPRKTLTIGAVNVPDEVFRDFLRGHLDGDGSIICYVDRYNMRLKDKYVYQRVYLRFISASRAHRDWLHSKVLSLTGMKGCVATDAVRIKGGRLAKNPLHRLTYAKREAIALLRWMYYDPNLPCLKRKREIAEPYLTGDLRDFRHPVQPPRTT